MTNTFSFLIISSNDTLLDAIKRMDDINRNLLIVLDKERFVSVVSYGDIQRALINNYNFNTPIKNIVRKKIRICYNTESKESVKLKMAKYKTEFMPIINNQNHLVDVLFWDDAFYDETKVKSKIIHNPVIVMAGGFGNRLKPLTNIIPKPLIPIGEKPIIEFILDKFYEFGIRNFFISINYKGDMIENYLNGTKYGDLISYVKESKPLGTFGSVSLIKENLEQPVFITNCDVLIEQDYRDILNYHESKNYDMTIVAGLYHFNIPYGTINFSKAGNFQKMVEKPDLNYFINAGLYLVNPSLFEHVPYNEFFNITDFIQKLSSLRFKIGVFPIRQSCWYDVGQWNDYKETLNRLKIKSFV